MDAHLIQELLMSRSKEDMSGTEKPGNLNLKSHTQNILLNPPLPELNPDCKPTEHISHLSFKSKTCSVGLINTASP